jgi:hypothetical protein
MNNRKVLLVLSVLLISSAWAVAGPTSTVSVLSDAVPDTIMANAGSNGTIAPSGSVSVNHGASQTFTFTPSTGYYVDSLIVDGINQASASNYTFTNVTTNHTIRITFAPPQPRIEVLQGTTLDFGKIFNVDKLTRNVTIKNTGTDTLHIKGITAQCGCTTTGLSEKRIAPKDTAQLTITFNPAGYPVGPVLKHVYIQSDDPKTAQLTIEFGVSIGTLYKVEPGMFTFTEAKADSVYTKTVTITNTSTDVIKLTGVDTKMDMIKTSLKKNKLKPGEQAELEATFHPTKSGVYPGMIEVSTDHPLLPKIEIRVYGWVTKK